MNQSALFSDQNIAWCIHEDVADGLRKEFAAHGFRCFELNARDIFDAPSFVRELVTALPSNPSYYNYHDEQEVNWAAVEDSLFGGLANEKSNVVVLWHSADRLVERLLNLTFINIDILFSIADSRDFAMKVLLVGKGPNFASADSVEGLQTSNA